MLRASAPVSGPWGRAIPERGRARRGTLRSGQPGSDLPGGGGPLSPGRFGVSGRATGSPSGGGMTAAGTTRPPGTDRARASPAVILCRTWNRPRTVPRRRARRRADRPHRPPREDPRTRPRPDRAWHVRDGRRAIERIGTAGIADRIGRWRTGRIGQRRQPLTRAGPASGSTRRGERPARRRHDYRRQGRRAAAGPRLRAVCGRSVRSPDGSGRHRARRRMPGTRSTGGAGDLAANAPAGASGSGPGAATDTSQSGPGRPRRAARAARLNRPAIRARPARWPGRRPRRQRRLRA